MAYAAHIDRLLEVLHVGAPAKVDALIAEKRRVRNGLLSVGLKVHCLGNDHLFARLIEALGGETAVLDRNVYRQARARFCIVLPPVGSAKAANLLLECIGAFTHCRMFDNPDIHLQVCSPGRLDARRAALHAIGFYLSSDTLRQYDLDDFATTISEDYYHRGRRLVIYDAGPQGDFDSGFAWWSRDGDALSIRPSLPFLSGRTDVLVGPGSTLDVENINLLATLLVHAQSADGDGFWSSLGQLFTADLVALLDRNLLSGIVDAPWICTHNLEQAERDLQFFSALQELTACAASEAARLGRATAHGAAAGGILREMQGLLGHYRELVDTIARREQGGASC